MAEHSTDFMADKAGTTKFAITPKNNWTHDLRSRMGIIGELFAFLWKVRLWWLIPMIVLLLIFVIVFIFGAQSPLAPLIYPLR